MAPTPSKITGATAALRLTKALTSLAAVGLRTPCQAPETRHLWLSDHEPERALAVRLCAGCPVELECWAASVARDERFGVWSSIDRTRHPNGKAG
jgi:Transcription factor WhiB